MKCNRFTVSPIGDGDGETWRLCLWWQEFLVKHNRLQSRQIGDGDGETWRYWRKVTLVKRLPAHPLSPAGPLLTHSYLLVPYSLTHPCWSPAHPLIPAGPLLTHSSLLVPCSPTHPCWSTGQPLIPAGPLLTHSSLLVLNH